MLQLSPWKKILKASLIQFYLIRIGIYYVQNQNKNCQVRQYVVSQQSALGELSVAHGANF